jgi:hypothetical protein
MFFRGAPLLTKFYDALESWREGVQS